MTDHFPGAEKVDDNEIPGGSDLKSDQVADSGQPDAEAGQTEAGPDDEPDTFPRSYVEELRQENGRYRQRAQQADEYARRLHTELVRATGRLADPTDLAFDPDHLDDSDKLSRTIDELLASKPHLAARKPTGDIGQGMSGGTSTVDLAAILRGKAG
ncbi:hypothetical protein MCHIJ_43200 [Mycolicibacterium chitae]|uniref:Uncharacterized protein n=1 Tax=Mycolicibacterium chitae TaxID=1792 RepID=A0A3S4TMT2_MYCCI|nr:hypothetical protein [Mycolicibacterium chitae]MCV7104215.1 hypothetical protein [Mycolicibacterium chitae]BBZ04883.1 hypothetical protein MCHIJ_43200 [Mycolicibacterium chitae]VEG48507.1 Uncharacterised protein [Mycolicibacterium chitae]